MNDHRITGAMLNSALYLLSCLWFGAYSQHRAACYCAIAAMGVTYLSYIAQLCVGTRFANAVVDLSIALGVAAGVLLFV